MYRLEGVRHTITAKEQAGADLVHGTGQHRGLRGGSGPGLVAVDTASELDACQRMVLRSQASVAAQSIGCVDKDRLLGATGAYTGPKSLRHPLGTLKRLIDDDPAIDHKEDAPGGGAFRGRPP